MSDPDRRAELIARIERERAWWRDLVDHIGEAWMSEPGPMGPWTFKDLAAHLLGWRERTLARLEAAADGRESPPPAWPAELEDDDSINAWIQERSRDRSVREVLDATDRSYERLAHAIVALPEDLVTRPGVFPWLDGKALVDTDWFGHVHDEHMPSVRAWLAARA
jgi:Mycothiol maleylpyruvate isomerase N-terminal domain.